jgi:hypothetical protein
MHQRRPRSPSHNEKITYQEREVYTSGDNGFDCEGRIDTSSCTFMKLRATPSRYQALGQRGCIFLHLRATSRALSPCLIRSQQMLWLAYMAASVGCMSSTCIYNEQTCTQFSSTGWWIDLLTGSMEHIIAFSSVCFIFIFIFLKMRLILQPLHH